MDKQTIIALNNSTKQSLELAEKALNSAKTETDVLEAKKAYDSALAEREQVVNQIVDFGLSASDPAEAKKAEALNDLGKIKKALRTQNFVQKDKKQHFQNISQLKLLNVCVTIRNCQN